MDMQLPPLVRQKLDFFLASGRFGNEEEILLTALTSLEREGDLEAAILQGLDEENRGESISARKVVRESRAKLG